MGKKRYAYIGGGFAMVLSGIGLAYLTGSMGFDWGRPIWHGLSLIVTIFGAYFIWYGIHRGYYERLLENAKRQILEEDTEERDI